MTHHQDSAHKELSQEEKNSQSGNPKKIADILSVDQKAAVNEFSLVSSILTPEEMNNVIKRAERERQGMINRQRYAEFVKSTENQPVTFWKWHEYLEDLQTAMAEEGRKFDIDDQNRHVLEALAMYFCNDPEFETRGENYSLKKGLFINGSVGVGKSMAMKLFRHNQKHHFSVVDCSDITAEFQKGGEAAITKYFRDPELQIRNDFNHRKSGWCFDDLGVESDGRYFGNSISVMGRIIDVRYREWDRLGLVTHMITNLGPNELKENYGIRFYDRCKEMFNLVTFGAKAESRRK